MINSILPSLLRIDRRQVLLKTSKGKAKVPGKPCGGSHISAAYKCRSHYTNGKLNAEGKKAAKEFAGKVRKLKGLPPMSSAKIRDPRTPITSNLSSVKTADIKRRLAFIGKDTDKQWAATQAEGFSKESWAKYSEITKPYGWESKDLNRELKHRSAQDKYIASNAADRRKKKKSRKAWNRAAKKVEKSNKEFANKNPIEASLMGVKSANVRAGLRRRLGEKLKGNSMSQSDFDQAFNAVSQSDRDKDAVKEALKKNGISVKPDVLTSREKRIQEIVARREAASAKIWEAEAKDRERINREWEAKKNAK